LLHAQVLAEVRQMTDAAVQQMQEFKEMPMTIEAVKNLYHAVAQFHGEVISEAGNIRSACEICGTPTTPGGTLTRCL